MIPAMAPDDPNSLPHRDGSLAPRLPPSDAPAILPGEGCPPMSLDAVRRRLRVRLLQDLVSRGLYRVPTEALAERLVDVLAEEE